MQKIILEKDEIEFEGQKQILTKDYFQFFKLLEKGQYSDVHLVQSKKTQKLYALKSIPKTNIIDHNYIEYIQNEIDIQLSLTHGHIIHMYSYFEDEENIYLVLEYAEKGNLKKFLKSNQLSMKKKAEYFYCLADAINYLHKKKPPIIHKGIDLNNVLLTAENTVKFGDFGCKDLIIETQRSKVIGMPQCAPEILLGKEITEKIDVWSLGVLLYEMVSGKQPFDIDNDEISNKEYFFMLRENITKNKPNQIHKFSPPLREFLLQMLEKDPADRITIKKVLNNKWLRSQVPSSNFVTQFWKKMRSRSKKKKARQNDILSFKLNKFVNSFDKQNSNPKSINPSLWAQGKTLSNQNSLTGQQSFDNNKSEDISIKESIKKIKALNAQNKLIQIILQYIIINIV